ncbi:family 43 glycosylhydrolase [Kribbella deserti]|uniref:Family 43 glycosylhydrolase n=1 Tax=Kribbella deserti TaxID=1926257 RepID=A0ABV6QLN5_9ACTN
MKRAGLVLAVLFALLTTPTAAVAAPGGAPEVPKTLIGQDFPDPDIVRVGSTWYAYATNNSGHLPVASAPTIDGPWSIRGDAMPGGPAADWARAGRTWAPDVTANPDGSFTLTYTAWHASSGRQCIGMAFARSPLGPFIPYGSGPFICPLSDGGAIDANTFFAADGTRYLTWKNDGNAINVPTTLYVRQAVDNGARLIGDRIAMISAPAGQVIEAPDLVQRDGRFYLFYSGGDYSGCGYYTSYATAWSLTGPWARAPQALMTTANSGVCGPGGADIVTAADGLTGGDKLVLHAYSGSARHVFSVDLSWVNGVPVIGGSRMASMDGNGRAEVASISADGVIRAWHNYLGFETMPYGASAVIAQGFTDPTRTRFADLDDDGKSEIIAIQANGELRAWHNDAGMAEMPYGDSVVIGSGFTEPGGIQFADLDDDGRAELILIQADGQVRAWHNDGAFSSMPYGDSRVIANGFTADRTFFPDLDGDGRAEIASTQADGQIRAWHNDAGFATTPYGDSRIVAQGFTDPARTRFADFDEDGRDEIVAIQANGELRAWHNDAGFATMPYGASRIVGTGFTDPSRAVFI